MFYVLNNADMSLQKWKRQLIVAHNGDIKGHCISYKYLRSANKQRKKEYKIKITNRGNEEKNKQQTRQKKRETKKRRNCEQPLGH